MPSHTLPSALIALYFAVPGAPWNFSKWQDLTGVVHGILPEDRSHAPRGLSPSDLDDLDAYFDRYNKIPREDDRIAFVARGSQIGGAVPGREPWRHYVANLWSRTKMHVKIAALLTENDCHPITIVNANPELQTNKALSSMYIPLVLDAFAREFYGPESLEGSGRLKAALRQPTQHLIQRTWINLLRQLSRSRTRLANLEKTAMDAFNDLESEKPTKAQLMTVIKAVSKWKALAQIFDDPATIDRIEEMDETLKMLMAGIGASVQPNDPKKSKGLCKISEKALKSLASQGGINDIINLYHDFFNPSNTIEPGPIIEELALDIPFGDGNDGTDFEAKMSPESLAANLDFKNGLPLLFNTHRDKAGSTPWNPPHKNYFDVNGPFAEFLEPIQLHWHQLAGVHALLRGLFTTEPDVNSCTGMLLADEVGLGKTFQVATLLTILSDVVYRQKKKYRMPPLIAQRPFLAGRSQVPDLPHLILVPGTLLDQWLHELQVLFKPNSFDIFVYGSGLKNHASFFDEKGPFHKSLLKTNRIILASHSALQQDFGLLHHSKAEGRGRLPWDKPDLKTEFSENEPKTLFGEKFLTVTIDEGHHFRNSGARHNAALAIMERAVLKLVATATPLLTSNADISGIGRIIGIPHFLSEACWIEEKADNADLRRARRDAMEEFDLLEVDLDKDQNNPFKLRQIEISIRQHSHFQGHIIRRTINSKDWEGQVLIKLPPYVSILGLLQLTKREMDIITDLTDSVKESVSTANGNLKVSSRAFYIESRVAVGYAQQGKQKIPHFTSLEHWSELRSTKMDVVARLCLYTQVTHSAPAVEFEDGVPLIPSIYPLQQQEYTGPVKIAIYQEFPSLGTVLRNVLTLYGIRHLHIDGQTSFTKRGHIVKNFAQDPSISVIIFSSVGSAGLNLAMASVMIFLDQPWSAQDERQIIGRVHRQPQSRTVKVYKLLAMDTADMILSTQARGKRDMMDAFLSKERGRELLLLYSQKSIRSNAAADPDDGDEDDEDEDDTQAEKPNETQKTKKTKPADEAPDVPKDKSDTQADKPTDSKKSKKRKPAEEARDVPIAKSKRSRKKETVGGGDSAAEIVPVAPPAAAVPEDEGMGATTDGAKKKAKRSKKKQEPVAQADQTLPVNVPTPTEETAIPRKASKKKKQPPIDSQAKSTAHAMDTPPVHTNATAPALAPPLTTSSREFTPEDPMSGFYPDMDEGDEDLDANRSNHSDVSMGSASLRQSHDGDASMHGSSLNDSSNEYFFGDHSFNTDDAASLRQSHDGDSSMHG